MNDRRAPRSSFTYFAALHGLAGAALLAAAPAGALTIVATYDSSVTSAQQTIIQSAITDIDSSFGGTSITVPIYFYNGGTSSSDTLGTNGPGYLMVGAGAPTYATYTGALATDASANPSNTILNTAVAHLASGNTAGTLLVTSADLAALGICTSSTACGQVTVGGKSYDGTVTVYFNTIATGIGFGPYNPQAVAEHEIDEILSLGGNGSVLNIAANDPSYSGSGPVPASGTTVMNPEDLYRYDCGSTTASLTTSSSASACFSVDGGATDIMPFNQSSSGDYGDWADNTPDFCNVSVQAAFGCPIADGGLGTLGTAEVDALEAIGYDPAGTTTTPPVPEPASLGLVVLGLGIGGLAMARRRHRY